MNEEHKQAYKDRYNKAKQKGVKFFPDIMYKDTIVMFALFLLLVGLATFIGVKPEPPADPNDATYIPRPEWYFLFLFEFLKFIPGRIEWVGTAIIPAIGILALLLLPFTDKNPKRHWKSRLVGISIMGVVVLGMIGLTIRAVITTPEQEEAALAASVAEEVILGQDLYSLHCVECHGPDGEGGEIQGVEGLEGTIVKSISSQDQMWTNTDETHFNITNYGQTSLGMPPFGLAYGGELLANEIDAVVAFMRYTWDERAEIPAEAVAAGAIPELAEGEVPSYEVHIQQLSKRYCISCHRPGKENGNYHMQTYEEILNTGDYAPNMVAGDLDSNLIRMINWEEIEAGGPMPPTKQMPDEYIDMWERWVVGGMPETAEEAAEATLE